MKINIVLQTDDGVVVGDGQVIYTNEGHPVGTFDGFCPDANGVPEVAIRCDDGIVRTFDLGYVNGWTLIPPSQDAGTTPRMLQLRASIAQCMKARRDEIPKPLADFVVAALGSESFELLNAANAALMDTEIPF